MKKINGLLFIVLIPVLGALVSCQSTTPSNKKTESFQSWPISPGQSLIQTEALGFSPMAKIGNNTIEFALYFANASSVKKWKVEIISSKGIKGKEFSGTASYLPAVLSWDGKISSKKYAPEGIYTAALQVEYKTKYTEGTAKSTEFILDTTSPTGKLSLNPPLFSPITDTDTITIMIEGIENLARIDSWTMEILDPEWNLFASFSGKWPNNSIVWNGKGINGDLVASAEDYPVIVRFRDEFGNTGSIESAIPIDILMIKDANGYRIENSRIFFQSFTADYENVPRSLSRQNISRLDRLTEKLKEFPDYKITIVGHAVMTHWEDKDLGKIEQKSVLIPLSKARAEAIKKAVVARGLNPAMITTEGVGADDPIVPDSDYPNRWKNRRTSLMLVK